MLMQLITDDDLFSDRMMTLDDHDQVNRTSAYVVVVGHHESKNFLDDLTYMSHAGAAGAVK